MYHILIAGAGYAGSAIARNFLAKKQKIFTLTRSEKKSEVFRAQGAHPLCMDLTQPETLKQLPAAHFIVFAAAPDISDEANYRSIYLEGLSNLLEAVKRNPRPHLFLHLSSTSVWRERAGGWVDETVPADPDTEKGKILLEAEQRVLSAGIPAVILRLAGIYGPGRNRLSRKAAPAQEPLRWMNMIHVEDIAQAIQPLFKSAREGGIYTAVDDEPVLNRTFYEWLRAHTGVSKPREPAEGVGLRHAQTGADMPALKDTGTTEGKRVSNQKLKSLNWKPQYPTFRQGYEELLKTRAETAHG